MTIMKRKKTNITNHNRINLISCGYIGKFKYTKLNIENNIRDFIK